MNDKNDSVNTSIRCSLKQHSVTEHHLTQFLETTLTAATKTSESSSS